MFHNFSSSLVIIQSILHKQQVLLPALLLIIEEAGVPIPVPGDIAIMYLGYEASRGLVSYVVVFALLVVATLIGSSLLFFLSAKFGNRLIRKVGTFIDVDEKRVQFVEDKFKKYGPWVIIVGRQIPGFRIVITIVSGVSQVTYKTFIICTFISSCLWVIFYLWLGTKLGPKAIQLFNQHRSLFSFLFIPSILLIGLYFLRASKKKR